MSKQGERRSRSPRKPKLGGTKTGPLKSNLKAGYKPHANALPGELGALAFIPKIK
jgi:hypothetical protein